MDPASIEAIDFAGDDGCDALLWAARGIEKATMLGHPVWGDGHPMKHGWRAMLAWNLAIASLCSAARG